MAEPAPPTRPVRVRTAATDKRKALDHYQEMRRSGKAKRAVVIAEDASGALTVLGQMLTPTEIAELLLAAASALAGIDQQRQEPRPEPHQEPEQRGVHNRQNPRPREITTDAAGMMVPPPGENIISCGECNHPRWYVLHRDDTDQPSRYACAHCGNEVKRVAVTHPGGKA